MSFAPFSKEKNLFKFKVWNFYTICIKKYFMKRGVLMENFQDERWENLVKRFRDRVEQDKKHFNCWSTYVKLPEICSKPKFLLIGMEPGPGNDRNEPEYRNFLANKEDLILNYCAYKYLGGEGFNYQITDMAKGGIKLDDARATQAERYRIWLPLLREEIELLGKPKVVFIGRGLYNLNNREIFVPPINKNNVIYHYSGANRGHVANYYKDTVVKDAAFISEFNNRSDVDVIKDIREIAEKLMTMHNYSDKLKGRILGELGSSFTDADRRLIDVYKYDFERFTKQANF